MVRAGGHSHDGRGQLQGHSPVNTNPSEVLFERLHQGGIIAVLVLDDPKSAVPMARALLAGGVNSIELTLRTPGALEALRRITAEVPEMIVGAGTVIAPEQVSQVMDAGAAFAVAPGTNPRVIAEAKQLGLPFAPGVCTPTDIEMALEQGCRVVKLFPSEPCGGLTYLRSIAAPYAHLGLRFIPLGGLNASNAATYLTEPSVLALGGSWLGPKDKMVAQDWQGITHLAGEASAIIRSVRQPSS